ncbi:PRC-barrel domain-containing protein [Falsiroseomonas sp. E2-1-a20]|uniref:PRC-barrel domain-containing protein n=1 Tax=Falsiroseomonas sp. E2-1-a20 TaxID=3239300 RepID=UPI003F309990
MNTLLTTTALAAVLALASTGTTQAQTSGQQQPAGTQSGQAAQASQQGQQVAQQLQQAEQSLRQALQRMQGAQGQQQSQAAQGVRQVLTQLQQTMQQLPSERRSAETGQRLEREVSEAQASIQGERPDMARARVQVEEVLVAIPVLRAELVGMPGQAAAQGAPVAGQIVVREAAPTVNVQQGQPTVTVRQPAPVITVVVPQPEIIVRQGQPQVTVQMPEPEVSVQMPEPQVRVMENQQSPQVRVTPAQPQVQVQRADPQVRVQQQGQPVIRFEQQGDAQVRVEQQAARTGATAAPAPAQSGGSAQQAAVSPAAGMPLARVQNLVGTNVIGANGRDAGEVENLLIDRNGQVRAAVVEWGGFLGLGESRAVVPIEQLRFGGSGERVRMDLTRAQLEALPRFERNRIAEYGRDQGWSDGVRLYR